MTAALQGYKQRGAYIATQGPLKSTVPEFWRMVHEFQCGCIVMLCELEEEGQVWADVNISWLYSPVKKTDLQTYTYGHMKSISYTYRYVDQYDCELLYKHTSF